MLEIILFAEDSAHETVIKALLKRLANESDISITVKVNSVRGGHGKALHELKQFLRDIHKRIIGLPGLIVIALDANCKGFAEKQREVSGITRKFGLEDWVIVAIPDPHIERWLLLDSAAFKNVLGKGCQTPPQKCERDLYKKLLAEAVRAAGFVPLLDGIEHAEDLIKAADLNRISKEPSLGNFIENVRSKFQQLRPRD